MALAQQAVAELSAAHEFFNRSTRNFRASSRPCPTGTCSGKNTCGNPTGGG